MKSAGVRTIFSCQKCGAQAAKWAGRCVECGEWGAMKEETERQKDRDTEIRGRPGKTVSLHEINAASGTRISVGIAEVDRVLGKGLTPGAVYLLAGEPGIGKSTLVAQIAAKFRNSEIPKFQILYVAGEESPEQLKQRFEKIPSASAGNKNIAILPDTNAETIAATMQQTHPALVIVDSVQTLTADAAAGAGAPTQLRAGASIITEVAKRTGIPCILIGQVTKSQDIAGPKSLEHLVDVVLTFEGDRHGAYRILRATKNRFGSTDEIGVFEMTGSGLREVRNPSAVFLETRSRSAGSIVTCVLEGSRPVLLEVQALTTKTIFPYPERRASGFDVNRLNLLLTVLAKSGALHAERHDVHLNITSGLRVREPAADLAVVLALASSLTGKPLPPTLMAFGEVGLGGELRPVRDPVHRITEAQKLGFTICIVPKTAGLRGGSHVQGYTHLREVLTFLDLK